jgi:hypothetical protein
MPASTPADAPEMLDDDFPGDDEVDESPVTAADVGQTSPDERPVGFPGDEEPEAEPLGEPSTVQPKKQPTRSSVVTNSVVRVTLTGGLLGLLFNDPATALDQKLNEVNRSGWCVVQVIPDRPPNLLVSLFRTIIFFLTLGLWCPATGYLIILQSRRGE